MQKWGFFKDAKYWRRQGAYDIQRMLQMEKYQSQAKNVIIFIGDGMGIQTHAMARIYKVKLDGKINLMKTVIDLHPR